MQNAKFNICDFSILYFNTPFHYLYETETNKEINTFLWFTLFMLVRIALSFKWNRLQCSASLINGTHHSIETCLTNATKH